MGTGLLTAMLHCGEFGEVDAKGLRRIPGRPLPSKTRGTCTIDRLEMEVSPAGGVKEVGRASGRECTTCGANKGVLTFGLPTTKESDPIKGEAAVCPYATSGVDKLFQCCAGFRDTACGSSGCEPHRAWGVGDTVRGTGSSGCESHRAWEFEPVLDISILDCILGVLDIEVEEASPVEKTALQTSPLELVLFRLRRGGGKSAVRGLPKSSENCL